MQLKFIAVLFSPTGPKHDNQCSLQAWKGIERIAAGGRPTLEFSGGDTEGKVCVLSSGKQGARDSQPATLKLVIPPFDAAHRNGNKWEGLSLSSSVRCVQIHWRFCYTELP